jgi:hypothetical protein
VSGRHVERELEGAAGRRQFREAVKHGTIFLLRPITDSAQAWVDEHLPEDVTWFCGAVVVEHCYIGAIVEGAIADGMVVRCADTSSARGPSQQAKEFLALLILLGPVAYVAPAEGASVRVGLPGRRVNV